MNSYQIGQSAEKETTITDKDICEFAGISGDKNPIHLDAAYAASSNFGQRIAHGMLVASAISNVIGTKFPGYGTIYVSQNLNFRAPVYINDKLKTRVEIIKIEKEKKRLVLSTTVTKIEEGIDVIRGEAVVIPPEWV